MTDMVTCPCGCYLQYTTEADWFLCLKIYNCNQNLRFEGGSRGVRGKEDKKGWERGCYLDAIALDCGGVASQLELSPTQVCIPTLVSFLCVGTIGS